MKNFVPLKHSSDSNVKGEVVHNKSMWIVIVITSSVIIALIVIRTYFYYKRRTNWSSG